MASTGKAPPARPQWRRLYEVASGQEGYFTTSQAAAVGYSRQLVRKHVGAGRILAVMRGIYRLVDYPPGEHEDLVVVWLWTGQVGVISHVTALLLHELSDALPTQAHVTVPESWRRRRLRVPSGVVLHFADIEPSQRSWAGSVPVTSVARTLMDCASSRVAPDLVNQAYRQALHRGLIRSDSVPAVTAYLATYFDMADIESPAASVARPRREVTRGRPMDSIGWNDFARVELRVGRVLEAREFPEARRPAYVLQVDFGPEMGVRKSSAQITHHYRPSDLVGRLVVAVVNLPSRQIGPLMSECLVTGFHDGDGQVRLCVPDGEVPLGAKLA